MASVVRKFYKKKHVLITGGTGFVGKMLVEKLIRSCDVAGIYLLIREKKGVCSEERANNIFKDLVFDTIKEEHPNFLQRIHIIEGDTSKECLGLSDTTKSLLSNKINVVFHCAASLNMDANLKNAIQTNCAGTLELINIFENSKNLDALVVVSTAYSASSLSDVIEEKFYEPPLDYKFAIEMMNKLDKSTVENISKGLFGNYPNSYVFTKILSEAIVKDKGMGRPFGVFRPTIILASLNEPVSGWTDNINGALGVSLATGTGILRVKRGNSSIIGDFVPVDTCANALLSCAWQINQTWREKKNKFEPIVYNYSSYKSNLNISYYDYGEKHLQSNECHCKYTFWVPFLIYVDNPIVFAILNFLLHTIPMVLVDTFLRLKGKKPILKTIYTKMNKTMDALKFFYVQSWAIRNDNILSLWKTLGPEDKKIFNFDLMHLSEEDVMEYFKANVMGLKKYILKEDMSVEVQRKNYERLRKLRIAHKTLKYSSVALLVYIAYKTVFWIVSLFI